MSGRNLIQSVDEALRNRCRIGEGDRLLVAVSGGADSVALLRALVELAGRPGWRLSLNVAHVNHGLRPDADGDEAFVRELAGAMGLPFHRRQLDLEGVEGNREAGARVGRYAALVEIAQEIGADAVAVAHHADDQLETILMRLIRGASVGGLSGMAWRRGLAGCAAKLIRPLLGVERSELLGYLNELGQDWREDSTNEDVSRWRARLRRDVLPVLREMRGNAAVKAVEAADGLRAAARLAEGRASRAMRRFVRLDGATATMDRGAARGLAGESLLGLLRKTCLMMGVPADQLKRAMVEEIAEAARDGSGETRRFDLAGGVMLSVAADTLRWERYDPLEQKNHEADDQR